MDFYLTLDPLKGLCLRTGIELMKGMCIFVDDVVSVPTLPCTHSLWPYTFFWGDDEDEVLSMGPTMFINHSNDPNCVLFKDMTNKKVKLIAKRTIKKDEELTFTYGCQLWFENEETSK